MYDKLKGVAALLLSTVIFSFTAIVVRIASRYYSGPLISGFRFLIGAILSLGLLFLLRVPSKIRDWKSWVLRGVFGAAAMITFYTAIQLLGSGPALVLCDTYPVFVSLFGFLLFRERIQWSSWLSMGLCIAGMILIFADQGFKNGLGLLMGGLSSILSGLAVLYVRRSSLSNHNVMVYLSACLAGLAVSPAMVPQLFSMDTGHIGLLILIGILTMAAQNTMTYGYRRIEAAPASILSYAGIPVGLVLSVLILNEKFYFKFITGSLLILAGLMVNLLPLLTADRRKTA
jgi:drug/metabolite transporter (DMT)-like permease